MNRIHRRDAVVIAELLEVADAIVVAVPSRRIHAMTGQAEIMAYHLVARHPGHINLLDLWSLTDRQLMDCFPPGAIETSKFGTLIGAWRPFARHAEITARCGLPLPDLFFNVDVEPHLPKLATRSCTARSVTSAAKLAASSLPGTRGRLHRNKARGRTRGRAPEEADLALEPRPVSGDVLQVVKLSFSARGTS